MGAGKTYLLLMLAVKLLHDFAKCKPKRLVALFSAHQSLEKVQVMVRDALLLAFWDDEQIQYKICAASERGELDIVVEDLKADHEFYFVFDNWNVYDEAPACREFLETIASWCPCIRGGSARQDLVKERLSHGAYPNYHKGQYEAFSKEELDVYLGGNKNIDRTDMLFWTGNFPLHVRLYLAAGNKYRVTNEVTALEAGLYDMVHRALELQGEARRSRLESFARLLIGEGDPIDFLEARDTRWVTMREGKVKLVSEFARSLLMGKVERAREANAADLAVVVKCFAKRISDECASDHPNKSLIGWMLERVVIHVAMTHAIGVEGKVDISGVSHFEVRPEACSNFPTVYVPRKSNFPHIDYLLRFVSDSRRLQVMLYQVSVGLQRANKHWQSASKFFHPENSGKFVQGWSEGVDWFFVWIGRNDARPERSYAKPTTEGGFVYQEMFFTFAEIANAFSASIMPACYDALVAASALKC